MKCVDPKLCVSLKQLKCNKLLLNSTAKTAPIQKPESIYVTLSTLTCAVSDDLLSSLWHVAWVLLQKFVLLPWFQPFLLCPLTLPFTCFLLLCLSVTKQSPSIIYFSLCFSFLHDNNLNVWFWWVHEGVLGPNRKCGVDKLVCVWGLCPGTLLIPKHRH